MTVEAHSNEVRAKGLENGKITFAHSVNNRMFTLSR
jgi:hypothetical protein